MKDLCTVFSKLSNSLNIQHVDDQGNLVNLTILPDYNINLDARKFAVIKKHPAIQYFLETGQLQEVAHINPKIAGEAKGLNVVDTNLKETAMVVDQNLVYDHNIKFKPTKDKLTSYHGVTPAIATKLLENMPEGGWQDKKSFLNDPNVSQLEIDWNPSNLKPEQVI